MLHCGTLDPRGKHCVWSKSRLSQRPPGAKCSSGVECHGGGGWTPDWSREGQVQGFRRRGLEELVCVRGRMDASEEPG
jgi:hypothetical protein